MTDGGPELWEGEPESPPAAGFDDLTLEYALARSEYEIKRAELTPFRDRLNAAEMALFDAMENQNLSGVRTTLGYFRRDVTVDAAVEDASLFAGWAKQWMPEILQPNYMRLSKLVRDALGAGAKRRRAEDAFGLGTGVLPPGVDFRPRRGIAWTRGGAATSAPKETT